MAAIAKVANYNCCDAFCPPYYYCSAVADVICDANF
jgi:hypothetical protein